MLKIGIINIMPSPSTYSEEIGKILQLTGIECQVTWLRLHSKKYRSASSAFLNEAKYTLEEFMLNSNIDALIISGAPVEHLNYDEVEYWPELSGTIHYARKSGVDILGLCWGALALAKTLGINKVINNSKHFGLKPVVKPINQPLLTLTMPTIDRWPFSTWANFNEDDVVTAIQKNKVRAVLESNSEIQFPVIESIDGKMLMCLAHPEYKKTRLYDEYNRDKQKGLIEDQEVMELSYNSTIDIIPSSITFFQSWLHRVISRKELYSLDRGEYPS